MSRCACFVLALMALASSVRAATPLEEFMPRLHRLHPDAPMEYFELAEEIAYESPSAQGRRLAIELFVLAGVLDARAEHPAPLGRSVCLALADLSTDSAERTWLLAMARSQAPAGDLRDGMIAFEASAGEADRAGRALAARRDLAMALARFRGGEARSLRTVLDAGDASRTLADAGVPQGDASALLSLVTTKIASMRRLRTTDSDGRFVRSLIDGVTTYALDDITGGNPGPALAPSELLLVLGVEARLVDAEPDAWAADLEVSRAQPVRDIHPASLARYFAVDVERVWFAPDPGRPDDPSAGAWSLTPSGEGRGEHEVRDQSEQDQRQVDDRDDEQPDG